MSEACFANEGFANEEFATCAQIVDTVLEDSMETKLQQLDTMSFNDRDVYFTRVGQIHSNLADAAMNGFQKLTLSQLAYLDPHRVETTLLEHDVKARKNYDEQQNRKHKKDAQKFETVPYVVPNFACKLRDARTAKGWTQKHLAQLVSFQVADLQSWEKGASMPTGPQRAKLNRVLGITLPSF